ncbi:MAG: LacI family DNA-binding transcriptional regulator [Pseudomonadota bacterium]
MSEAPDPRRRVTSYDVARHAGVSQSAVSRCFKPGASVSQKMRSRVMKAAQELGYQPNAIARSLITRRSHMVAVVISEKSTLYFPELLVALSQRLSEQGVRVLLFTLENESDVDTMLDQILQYQVDGMIVAARLSAEQIDAIESRRVPFVFYNRSFRDRQINAVCCDHTEGERWLINRLVDYGHRRFGLIAGPEDSAVGVERTQGALERLRELSISEVEVVVGDYSYESGGAGLLSLVDKLGGAPDAVICANDIMALGCIDAARHELKLAVPDDLSVVGFDGVGPARWKSYQLTTVRQPVGRMTEAAVSMLLERAEDPNRRPEKRFFSGDVVTGGSALMS